MVVGPASLALVARLHAVVVHHRHAHHLDVLAEPLAEVVVRHERVGDSLDHPARQCLGGVVATRDEDAVLRRAGKASVSHARDIRALARLAERLQLHLARRDVRGVARDERLPVREHVRMALVEECLVLLRTERVGELVLLRLAVERIGERLAAVRGDDRTAHSDGPSAVLVGKDELHRLPRGALHAERPVEPAVLRVAQVLPDLGDVAFDRVNDDVPGGNVVVDGERRRRVDGRRDAEGEEQFAVHVVRPLLTISDLEYGYSADGFLKTEGSGCLPAQCAFITFMREHSSPLGIFFGLPS